MGVNVMSEENGDMPAGDARAEGDIRPGVMPGVIRAADRIKCPAQRSGKSARQPTSAQELQLQARRMTTPLVTSIWIQ